MTAVYKMFHSNSGEVHQLFSTFNRVWGAGGYVWVNSRVILISMNFRISNFAGSHVYPIASLVSEQFLFSL